jgi:phosphoserine phosphatase
MINSKIYISKILDRLNPLIKNEFLRIQDLNIPDSEKIAAFDLDNTLINGDICESVFCYLKANNFELDLKWSDYLKLLDSGNFKKAYCDIITALKGLNIRTINSYVQTLINSNSIEIHFEEDGREYKYPLPKIKHDMINLIVLLKISGWKVSIISASSHIMVRKISDLLFKLNPEFVHGIKTEIEVTDNYEDLFTDKICGIITYSEGKSEQYKQLFGEIKPLITAGDSIGDIELINLTSEVGFSIICGNTISEMNSLKSLINQNIKTINSHNG